MRRGPGVGTREVGMWCRVPCGRPSSICSNVPPTRSYSAKDAHKGPYTTSAPPASLRLRLNNNERTRRDIMQDTEIVLSDNEIHMLNALASKAGESAQSVERLLTGVELTSAQGLSALGYLCAKGLAESAVIGSEQKRVLRKAGQDYLEQGLPEQRLWHYLIERGSLTLQGINAYLPQSEAKFTI